MSLIYDVLLAAHEAGIPNADVALLRHVQLERDDLVTLIAADGNPIATMFRRPGEKLVWEAPAPFFAVALAGLRIETHVPEAIRLESE